MFQYYATAKDSIEDRVKDLTQEQTIIWLNLLILMNYLLELDPCYAENLLQKILEYR